ncbi:MAG: hypothetical protein ACLTDR_12135 [Adlercreutzia equolifaciens]
MRRADVLVIAEPIRAYALENHRSERECDKALADRIETIFRVAAANGAETLIMGAFGCGRNGYPVEQVIELIQNWIAEHPGAVPNVVLAVPRMHADAFRRASAPRSLSAPRRWSLPKTRTTAKAMTRTGATWNCPRASRRANDGCSRGGRA